MYDNGKILPKICLIIQFQNRKIYVILKRIKVKVCGYGRISDGRTDENDEMEIDLIELFHVLLKKAWVILLCLVIGAVTVGGYTKLFVTPQYQATSTIYVLGNSVSMSGVDLTLSKQLTADFSVLAKSRPVMNKIEEKLKADYKYKDLNYSVEQLQGMITIENPSGTSLMRMTATNSDAQLAADIANAAADAVAERISEVMVIDKPSSVEEAEKPNYPVSPNVKKNMIMGGLIGAVLAVGVFTLLFLLDDTIKSEEDVRRYLQLNTLASIPKEKKRRRASSEA